MPTTYILKIKKTIIFKRTVSFLYLYIVLALRLFCSMQEADIADELPLYNIASRDDHYYATGYCIFINTSREIFSPL